jgi:hypothetical protein
MHNIVVVVIVLHGPMFAFENIKFESSHSLSPLFFSFVDMCSLVVLCYKAFL